MYLIMFPLLFTSSIKTAYPKAKFKPEYIIPNLLMQWIRGLNENERYFGILYSSSKIDKKVTDMPWLFYNVVIPSRSPVIPCKSNEKDKQFCQNMITKVRISNPINCDENFEKVKPDFGEYDLIGNENNVNEHLKSHIYSLSQDYRLSPFANIENLLDNENLKLLFE